MLDNKGAATILFGYIESLGYRIKDIEFKDSYFIFDVGKDSVVSFKIKGLRCWRFGMWIGVTESPALQFFCQYEEDIDKFKPSHSYFYEEYSLAELKEASQFSFYHIGQMLKTLRYHPILAYVMNHEQCHGVSFYAYPKSLLKYYIKNRLRTRRERFKSWVRDWIPYFWTRLKLLFCGNSEIIESVDLHDDGCDWSPRFELLITFKESSTEEQEVKFLNKWFKKWDLGNLRLRICRIGIEGYYTYV